MDQLRDREAEQRRIRGRIDELLEWRRGSIPLPTCADIRSLLDEARRRLLSDFDTDAAPVLRRLIHGHMRAVPYRKFDGDSLHLRAHFTLNLVGLLPRQWEQLLQDSESVEPLDGVAVATAVPMVVDLFKVPKRIRAAKAMYELVKQGLTLADAARHLDLPETTGNKAYRTGRAMAEQGLDDAYIELTDMPARPSRWRSPSGRTDAFDAA